MTSSGGSDRPMVGPGVVKRRPEGRGDPIVVGRREAGPSAGASAALGARSPALDPEMAPGGATPRRRVVQCTVPAGGALAQDIVLGIGERPVRWNGFARGMRSRNWRALDRVSRGRYALSLRGAELRVRGPEARADGSEAGEVAWRFWLRNVRAPRSRDLVMRLVIELAAPE